MGAQNKDFGAVLQTDLTRVFFSCVVQTILILIYTGVDYLLLTTSDLVIALYKPWITCDLRREVFKRGPVCGAVNTM